MSKNLVVGKVAKFSPLEINQTVSAVALPPALQGVDSWDSSRAIGGNVASYLAAANGKAQTIGLCQCFAAFWFGAESRANLVKGLSNVRVRKAFDAATMDVIRLHGKALESSRLLGFLQDFIRASMSAELVKPEIIKVEKAPILEAAAPILEAAAPEAVAPEAAAPEAAAPEAAAPEAFELEMLKAEIAALKEFKAAVFAAKTLKEIRALA